MVVISVLSLGKFLALGDKKKISSATHTKGFAYDAWISMANVHKISNSEYEKGICCLIFCIIKDKKFTPNF